MSLINRTGTFRGTILDHGVSASKNGFPQWTPKLQATEYYDEETKTWVDWAGVPENEITGFIILKDGKKKVTLSAQQIVKAIGWSGQSYAELGSMDLNDTKIHDCQLAG